MPETRAHRADIDGLRAVAVLPVLFFHAGFTVVSGGFIGVDVFFVISGFLITSIIARELGEMQFSLWSFYERRIRRIFPALFAVILGSSVAAYFLLMPLPFFEFGESVGAAAAFASNILFSLKIGYFDLAATQKPLLHTWSLAIEEQFYLVFPPLMWMVTRFAPRWRTGLLGVLAVSSFGYSLWLTSQNPILAFYSTPGRASELLLGSLVALGALPVISSRPLREAAYAFGLILILCGLFLFSPGMTFPGWFVLLPACGTALILHAGDGAPVWLSRLLSVRPLVFVGLISYSLYLWHWPLLAFARIYALRPLTTLEASVVLSVAGLLSIVSWRYVEQPFRGPRKIWSRQALFAAAAGCVSVSTAIASWTFVRHDGWPERFSTQVQALLLANRDVRLELNQCFNLEFATRPDLPLCRVGARNSGQPEFVVWGDLHAAAIAPAIADAAARHGTAGLVAARGGCPPLLGVRSTIFGPANACELFNARVLRTIERQNIKSIFLVARWTLYAEGTIDANPGPMRSFIWDLKTVTMSAAENKRVMADGFTRTVQYFTSHGRSVVIVGPVPEISDSVPEALALRANFGRDAVGIGPSLAAYLTREKFVLDLLQRPALRDYATIVLPSQWLCDSGECKIQVDGHPLYCDDNHLSLHGAEYITHKFDRFFVPAR